MRLKDKLMKVTGKSMADMAKELSMTEQNLGIHLRKAEKNGSLNYELGLKIKDRLKVLFDDGEFFRPDMKVDLQADESGADYTYDYDMKDRDPKDRLPIYDFKAKGGVPYLINALDQIKIIDYISMPGYRDCIGFVQVAGDSMSGFVEDGEYIAIKAASKDDIFWGSAYLVIFTDVTQEEPLVKYIREGDVDRFILRSHNYESYPDMKVEKSKILSIFRVKGILKLKRVR